MANSKLLLADDSITIQKVVNLTFADEGIDVVSVGDGNSAMEKFVEISPDLVMADVNMPGLDGYRICEIIKQDIETRHIPVILLVGSFEPFDEEEANRVGASGYLTKPFQSIRQLVEKVSELLENSGSAKTQKAKEPKTIETAPVQIAEPEPRSADNSFVDTGMDDEMIEENQINSLQIDETQKFESPIILNTKNDSAPDQLRDLSYQEYEPPPGAAETQPLSNIEYEEITSSDSVEDVTSAKEVVYEPADEQIYKSAFETEPEQTAEVKEYEEVVSLSETSDIIAEPESEKDFVPQLVSVDQYFQPEEIVEEKAFEFEETEPEQSTASEEINDEKKSAVEEAWEKMNSSTEEEVKDFAIFNEEKEEKDFEMLKDEDYKESADFHQEESPIQQPQNNFEDQVSPAVETSFEQIPTPPAQEAEPGFIDKLRKIFQDKKEPFISETTEEKEPQAETSTETDTDQPIWEENSTQEILEPEVQVFEPELGDSAHDTSAEPTSEDYSSEKLQTETYGETNQITVAEQTDESIPLVAEESQEVQPEKDLTVSDEPKISDEEQPHVDFEETISNYESPQNVTAEESVTAFEATQQNIEERKSAEEIAGQDSFEEMPTVFDTAQEISIGEDKIPEVAQKPDLEISDEKSTDFIKPEEGKPTEKEEKQEPKPIINLDEANLLEITTETDNSSKTSIKSIIVNELQKTDESSESVIVSEYSRQSLQLSPDAINKIADRVADRIAEQVVQQLSADVVSDLADLIAERIERKRLE